MTHAGDSTPPAPPSGADRGALLLAVATVALVVGFVFVLWRIAPAPPPDLGPGAHVLPVPLEVPAFELIDHRGEAFDRNRLLDRWSLLFFGYTYCPDVCPLTLQKLAPVLDLLGPDSATQVVFVSVDPARDDTSRLAEYVAFFHPQLIAASGDPDEIDRLTQAIGVFHRKSDVDDGGDGYLVDHSASLFLVDPRGRLHAILHEPDGAEAFVTLLLRAEAVQQAPATSPSNPSPAQPM